MGKLIAIRHGQSTFNQQNRFTGWLDVDLSEKGIQEAEKAGKLLKELNINIDVCFTSCLKRAIDTLEIVLKILGKNIKYTKDINLSERHYGNWTGNVKEEMKKKLGEEQFMKIRRGWDIRPPSLDKNSEYSSLIRKNPLYKGIKNIPDTESLKDTYNRAVPYFEKEILIYLKQNKNVILSAHGNSIRAIGKKIFNISDEKINFLEIPTSNPMIIDFDNSGKILGAKYLDESRKKEIISNQ